ncbi:zinc finger MYM-type protein 1-like [Aphis craccivora]|uniref:Zinc finger MYM-type protein 1-like n=1 Tax=Aphis craccivora TaxID=307492 RepID=A0A6G0W1N3_APHCR|nr:zinc finger MYM-type protein 1-like [Aphis craccivora]
MVARVCSLHFDSSDYEKPLIQRMLEYSPKHHRENINNYQRKLKPNAVPSKNLPRIQKPTIKCKVQLLNGTQDVGIQCELGMGYSGLQVEKADVSTQFGDNFNEVENLKQHLLDLHSKLKKEK